ncbi:GTP cyclohydrolase II [Natronospira proteinivora]|uniref:GTP cyclohydrolase-2 n=1 Tax=Natronospira proteinivora TaxID=1807133 RepID=A0ABT1G5N3_9GAMM|nr:GTP cyclohydrolase II [Natronospira proteinivora]MCP1726250.1 GTP cyclohydrolase II [Natronospira proteinivora]
MIPETGKVSVVHSSQCRMPTRHGCFEMHVFTECESGREHVALVLGDLAAEATPLCRVHSECLTGEVLGSLRCDCGSQLDEALSRIAAAGAGVLVYLRQEGRGIGLTEKIRAYALQDEGLDTVEANQKLGFEADLRSYRPAADILRWLGAGPVRLMTNNPAKLSALKADGIAIHRREAIIADPNAHNQSYLDTKRDRMGHLFEPSKES